MSRLDRLIEETLSEDDRRILKETEELGWFQLGARQFTGKLGWVTWVLMTVQTVMFLGGVWCGIEFYSATETLPALKWGLTGALLVILATILKTSLMPQMQADRVIREVKRVELMLARQKS